MSKKAQSEFEQNIKDGLDAIRSVVITIAKKEALKYEIEIYSRLKAFCEEQIDVIREVDECGISISCNRVKEVMKGGEE